MPRIWFLLLLGFVVSPAQSQQATADPTPHPDTILPQAPAALLESPVTSLRQNHISSAATPEQQDSYWGFEPLDWSVDMVELAASRYLLQDQYLVDIPAFRISRFQVTQQFYHSVMRLAKPQDSELYKPVVNISWFDAVRFTNELSRLAGLEPAYSIRELRYEVGDSLERDQNEDRVKLRYEVEWLNESNGYRLPTEAEWEYAAHGGAKMRRFLYSGSNTAENVAWYSGNSNELHEVGLKEPNEIGLYDMSGNAWDWLWDRFIPLNLSQLAEPGRLDLKDLQETRTKPILGPEDLSPIGPASPLAVDNPRNLDNLGAGTYGSPSGNFAGHRNWQIWRGPSVYDGRMWPQSPQPKDGPTQGGKVPTSWASDEFTELRTCRGGGWNFAKHFSQVQHRSPCIAQADYYVSVSFRLVQSVVANPQP